MYTFSTVHLAQRWQLIRAAFIAHGDTAGTIFNYMLHQPQWSIMLGATMLSANTVLADCVLVSTNATVEFFKAATDRDVDLALLESLGWGLARCDITCVHHTCWDW